MRRLAGVAVGVVIVIAAWLVFLPPWHGDPAPAGVPPDWARPTVDEAGLVTRSGVKITQVAVTGGGGLVDLRYQVVDPTTAAGLHDPAKPPAIVDETSGLVVHDLLMSHAHTGTYRAGVTYYYVFVDPVNWVHRGAKVTVLLGDAQVEHVVVR
jgi:hypothetical protein